MALAGTYCCLLLYNHALGLPVFFRRDVFTTPGQFIEHVLRTLGVALFIASSVLVWRCRSYALVVALVGAIAYVLPWLYAYASSVALQPEPHLKWHMLRSYPLMTWQWLLVPAVFVSLVLLAVRRGRPNPSLHPTSAGKPAAAGELKRWASKQNR